MSNVQEAIAPAARVVIRDAEWVVRRVDQSSDGGRQLTCDGLSELVRDRRSIFLTKLEDDIEILDPANTTLVNDSSPHFADSLLYLESHLQRAVPNDAKIHAAQNAAMRQADYQFTPALQALEQPRQRILIADAVGLGKTLEAGILTTELIRRGKGRRILVVALKSMLTQFQKEYWNRFTIPLTRLDSAGLARVRGRIPANHNPFYYYDKSIISIDTLKQDSEFRVYLEQARWDIIIIDEAHNVADKGNSSQRARLAELLATRSDTLMMLSATPHNGRARSFASLLNMLDPTAIVDPDDYSPNDFDNKGLVIRRFKKDIRDQVEDVFRERRIYKHNHKASAAEEAAYEALLAIPFTRGGEYAAGKRGALLRVGMQKTLFSSPAACAKSIDERIKRLPTHDPSSDIDNEIAGLQSLAAAVNKIKPAQYAKYQTLIELLKSKDFAWNGKDTNDRLVIFSERIETLEFLRKQLQRDLKLKTKAIDVLTGAMNDLEQQAKVETFAKPDAPVRILLCSDVASEGINLHYLSHRVIHFDLPWSLMLFQQRNGRIDRFGQTQTPQIHYLVTESDNETVRGDTRILEILAEKDEQAHENIGDPSAFMGVYDTEKEDDLTQRVMASGMSADAFNQRYTPERQKSKADQFLDMVQQLSQEDTAAQDTADTSIVPPPSVFDGSAYRYAKAALQQINRHGDLEWEANDARQQVALAVPPDLRQQLALLPPESTPEDGRFVLTEDIDAINAEIQRCRQDEQAWPKTHYLWPQHPVMEWLADRSSLAFARQTAPVIWMQTGLERGEAAFIINGQLPNKRGHPLVYEWFAVRFINHQYADLEPLADTIDRTGLQADTLANPASEPDIDTLQALVPKAVKHAGEYMRNRRDAIQEELQASCTKQLETLRRLRGRQQRQLTLTLERSSQPDAIKQDRQRRDNERIANIFDEQANWITESLTAEHRPHLQVVAVLADKG